MSSVSDITYAVLRGLGYTGTYSDMLEQFSSDGGLEGFPALVTKTLTSGSPNVDVLASVNHWDCTSGPVEVILPSGITIAEHTVHITGFSNLSWPVGTVLYGANTNEEVWVHLIRDGNHWTVLIPGTLGVFSSFTTLLNAIDTGGGPSYSVGNVSTWGSADWRPSNVSPVGTTLIQYNKSYSRVRVEIGGCRATTSNPTGSMFQLPPGFRPNRRLSVCVPKSVGSGVAVLTIDNTGSVVCTSGVSSGDIIGGTTSTEIGLASIEFDVEL